jgi:WD40 repeat protein
VRCQNLAISQDGRILTAVQADEGRADFTQCTVWNTATGEVIARMSRDRASLGRPAWLHVLAGGRVLASRVDVGDGSHSVALTRIEDICKDSQQPNTVTVTGISSASFIPDADFWFACDAGKPKVRDAFTGAIRLTLPCAYENLVDIACSANGQLLAIGCNSGLVIVIDRVTGAEVARHDFESKLCLISLSPAGDVVSEVDLNGVLKVWSRHSGQTRVFSKDGVGQCLRTPAFSADGSRMATLPFLSSEGMKPAAVWEVATGRRFDLMPTQNHPGRLWFAADSRTLIADGTRSPRIWHLDPPAELPSPVGHLDEAWSAAYSADGKLLVTGSDDTDEPHTIKLWNPVTAQLIRAWCGGRGTVASLAFSPDGRTVATGHLTPEDGVRIWDVSTGKLLSTLRGHKDMVRSIAFSPDGRLLATAGGNRNLVNKDWNIRIWDVAASRPAGILEGHTDVVRALAFSPDGRTLASASHDQTLRLWDHGTGRILRTARYFDHLIALAFLPSEGTLAAAQENGAITIHDAASLEITKTIRVESDPLLNIAVAPDGRSLATCSLAGKIRLWDALSGQELLTLLGHKAQVNGIAFAPDGTSLTSCSHDGAVKIWRAQ